MDNKEINKILINTGIQFTQNTPLKEYTTWKIGGNADFLFIVYNNKDLIYLSKLCIKNKIPYTILGHGSNVLISDDGIRGVVIINRSIEIEILSKNKITSSVNELIKPRLYDSEFSKIDYFEKKIAEVLIKISTGTPLSYTINYLLNKGITGLQWFAGIPGTIGGAVFNNIHGGSHFINEYIKEVTVVSNSGDIITYNNKDISFRYDYSSFQNSSEILIDVILNLNTGNKEKALLTAEKWIQIKREVQQFNTAGCCFKNISEDEKVKYDLPNVSWGYLIDKILKLKGKRSGKAMISKKHAAFIENLGGASSEDVLNLINIVYKEAKDKIGITPKAEIFFLGFKKSQIDHLI